MAFVANDNQQLTLTDSTLNLTQKKGKIWTYDSVYAIGTNYADTALNLVREAGGEQASICHIKPAVWHISSLQEKNCWKARMHLSFCAKN